MPVVGNNRCLELDSVVLQRFRSCSSLVVYDISVVAGAGSYGPDCSDVQRGRRLGYAFRVVPTGVGRVFLVFSPVPGAVSFLSCSTSSSTLSGSGCSSRSTGTPDVSASCADAVTCLWFALSFHSCGLRLSRACSSLCWTSSRPRTARSPQSWCRWWCPGWCSGRFGLRRTFPCPGTADVSVDTALVSVDTSLVSENTVLVLESRALVSEDTALVSLFPCPWSFHRCGYWTGLLGPCGGDYTGAVLVLSGCVFCRCRGYSIHYIWRCRRCSSSSRTLTSPSWRRGFSHGPDFSAFPYFSPSCRTRSGCPGCAVASSATGAVLSMNVAVLAQRQVPAALCAGWAPGPFIDLSVGSV